MNNYVYDRASAERRAQGYLDRNAEIKHSTFSRIREFFDRNPDRCLVPESNLNVRYRINGFSFKTQWRALAYFDRHGRLPDHQFTLPSCGTVGCVNPDHQSVRTDDVDADGVPFGFSAPRALEPVAAE